MTEFVKITESVTSYLDMLRDRIRDPRVPLAHLVPLIREYFARQFETLGSEGGSSWAPLTASTMERHGVRPQMLMETGALWASLVEEGARFGFAILNGDTLRVGTTDPVAHLLEGGTRRGIPPRDIEGAPPAPTVERWSDLVADDLTRE